MFLLAGCGTRTLLVEPGVPVRLAAPVDAVVLVKGDGGRWIQGRSPVRLPAGWYVLPPPATRLASRAAD